MTSAKILDGWEDENWLAIAAMIAAANESFERGEYTEFDLRDYLLGEGDNIVANKQS